MHVVEETPLVVPRLSRGLNDLLPWQAIARNRLIEIIRNVYELYGYLPLETPAIEYADVLFGSAGSEAEEKTFKVVSPEREALALRFDHTVPLARFVSQHPELPRPFRRYVVGPVWRADKPDPGRFRQFIQFDLDSVGVPGEVADIEVIAAMCDILTRLVGKGKFIIRLNSRGVLQLIMPFAGIAPEHGPAVLRAIDKIDRVGWPNVRRELMEGYKDSSGDTISGAGLTGDQADLVEVFLGVQHERRDALLEAARDLFGHIDGALEQLDILDRISRHLYRLGHGDDQVTIDFSVARGLSYYTGPIFEAHLLDAPQFGAVFSGGRYDNLTARFSGEKIPATGASVGVDRLLAALIHLGVIDTPPSTAQVLVTSMDPRLTDDYIDMTWELRRAGIRTELYLGEPAGLKKQLKYADRGGVPLAVIFGDHEKEHGTVTIKNLTEGALRAHHIRDRENYLSSRTQVTVERAHLVATVKNMLGGDV